ncbi:MAG: tRNA uridine-5-carboxymethylaminomethyl(34) synthesis GTPase MnmE [Clostridia bacterium]|nr:tRNA uridine-5-carboxymethylaminomethyl(34) synthesis GTPase MnmE [Clostridia bacterium]
MQNNDLIYALATPVGGAIAVIRMSGPECKAALSRIFTGKVQHRYASFGHIVYNGETIDEVIAVCFDAPKSYTGEEMAEISVHGGQATVSRVMEVLSLIGCRCARGGEFTERAFLNGKMDLTQAEAVMDIVNASSRRGAKSALEQLQGKLSERIQEIESELLDALSGIDAAIDYPEELEEDVFSMLPSLLKGAYAKTEVLIKEGLSAKVLREGAKIAILGVPNAGKSSLLNALLGTERAIVTSIPGTTRDTITEAVSIGGMPVRLIDTAGLRETDDEVEKIGVSLARKAAENADLILIAIDGSKPLTEAEKRLFDYSDSHECIAVICKNDIERIITTEEIKESFGINAFSVSSKSGDGIERIKTEITKRIEPENESPVITNIRHIEALLMAKKALKNAVDAFDILDAECLATDIRSALSHIGSITGKEIDAEVIDRIFSRFCVGK